VRIINNNVYDVADMEFTGTLSTADPAVRLNPSTFSIRIRDDDAASLIISFSQRVFTGYEGNSSMSACATIIRGQLGAGSHVDVNITTNTDTIDVDARVAVEGRDYGEAERIIRFDSSHTPESEPQCLEIPILEDEVLEDGETYFVELFKVDKRQDFLLRPFTVRAVIEDNDSECSHAMFSRHTAPCHVALPWANVNRKTHCFFDIVDAENNVQNVSCGPLMTACTRHTLYLAQIVALWFLGNGQTQGCQSKHVSTVTILAVHCLLRTTT
jgi:hypothetical protein